jgi:hypothetical protein
MSDPWYLLQCPSCKSQMRIKTAYSHMRGRCPVCKQWIESKVPKPLSMSDEGTIEDEVWPEPPQLTSSTAEMAEPEVQFTLKSPDEKALPQKIQAEDEGGGVYNLAFEPDMPAVKGVTRSAEWDQAGVPNSVAAPPPPLAPVPSQIPKPPPVHEPTTETYQTVIDPLFGDEVKVAVKPAATLPPPPQAPAPVAKLADPLAEPSSQPIAHSRQPAEAPQLSAPVALPPPLPDTIPKKKKKKKADDAAPPPSEDLSHLNKPATDTHLYRLSDAEENRIKLDAPPSLLFFDGVFLFPWTGKNLFPWIWLTLGFIFIYFLKALVFHIMSSESMFAQVGAAATGLASFMMYVMVLSYGCACWVNTINYTAAGSIAVEWYTEGFKDNLVRLLQVGYYFVLAMMMATPLLLLNVFSYGWVIWLAGTLFLFPIFLFSGFASLTFWNFLHQEVIKKTIAKLHYYLTMYGMSLFLFAFVGISAYMAVQYYMIAFIAGPITAAVWLIYGRLLGRMAYLLQQEPRKRKKKKKKKVEGEEGEEETSVETAGKVTESIP